MLRDSRGVKLYGVVYAQLQASHYAPAQIIDVRVVEPKVSASTLAPLQCGEGKNAPQQSEIAYRECTLELLASQLIRTAGLGVDPHGGHILAFNTFILGQRFPKTTFFTDGTKLIVRQHSTVHAHIGLHWAAVTGHQIRKPHLFRLWNGQVVIFLGVSAFFFDEFRRPSACPSSID